MSAGRARLGIDRSTQGDGVQAVAASLEPTPQPALVRSETDEDRRTSQFARSILDCVHQDADRTRSVGQLDRDGQIDLQGGPVRDVVANLVTDQTVEIAAVVTGAEDAAGERRLGATAEERKPGR